MGKVGLGVITCNREEFYKQCCESIPLYSVDHIVTVNDGDPYKYQHSGIHVYQNDTNLGVGKSKNKAMQHLLNCDCEHIFLIEDDIIIKNSLVFEKYIDTACQTGLWHLMFGYHGPANKNEHKFPNPRLVVEYSDECKVAFNLHCVGAFCYYHRGVLTNIGRMDEQYKNAWEHVDHSFQIAKKGLLPAYWWWPDVANSCDYLDELACSEESSTIRWEDAENKVPKKDWQDNIQTGMDHFVSKHSFTPVQVPDTPVELIQEKLKFIRETYSRNEAKL